LAADKLLWLVAVRIEELSGIPQEDVREAARRLPRDMGLAPTQPGGFAEAYGGRERNLRGLLERFSELDQNETTRLIWQKLCKDHAPLLAEAGVQTGRDEAAPGQQRAAEPHPDGLEGGRWLWWGNKRHDIPQGIVYRLLAHMWDRDSASYDALQDAGVLETAVQPQTIRSYANKANNALPPRFPWRLSTDSNNRQLTKVSTADGA
jgi:hypothetical protein